MLKKQIKSCDDLYEANRRNDHGAAQFYKKTGCLRGLGLAPMKIAVRKNNRLNKEGTF